MAAGVSGRRPGKARSKAVKLRLEPSAGRGGKEGERREGRGGAGKSGERASGLAAPELPLSVAAAVALAAAGPDSPGAQGVCPAARGARRLLQPQLLAPARARVPEGIDPTMQLQFRSWMLAALTLLVVFLIFADISEIEEEIG